MSTVNTHDAHVRYAVYCGVCDQTIAVEIDRVDAADIAVNHNADHALTHTEYMDERSGEWIGVEDCKVCAAYREHRGIAS